MQKQVCSRCKKLVPNWDKNTITYVKNGETKETKEELCENCYNKYMDAYDDR